MSKWKKESGSILGEKRSKNLENANAPEPPYPFAATTGEITDQPQGLQTETDEPISAVNCITGEEKTTTDPEAVDMLYG